MINTSGLDKLSKNLGQINKNTNYVAAVSLTKTAIIGREDLRNKVDEEFTLRNKWTIRGINIRPATKESLYSEIFIRDWYMRGHEGGENRKARSGYYLIPGKKFYEATGKDKSKVIPKSYRVPAILNKKIKGEKPFEGKFRSGAKFVGLRPGKERARNDFYVLYIQVKQKIHIRGRKYFDKTTEKTYNNNFQKEYDKAWNQYILNGVR